MNTATSRAPAIRVQGIEKAFGEVEVLRGADFEVERGTVFALLGSNGAGKTTLVRIMSTLLAADAGIATVNGHDVVAAPAEVRESISLTGQFAAVDDVLTGRRTSSWSHGFATWSTPGGSPTTCSPGSRSPRPAAGGPRPTRAACGGDSTSP
ncbi:hypothetical protein GCM10025870_11460 [Agromyces marinus]|uniref:ABC transporter domain-containing protein n=1 Tax=Agromyces marinus TaxID=1389020 RepID=A0ABM8H024_9MICO|nr:hypothetical protein GCM10025870_11460 [Agromyces marinus]